MICIIALDFIIFKKNVELFSEIFDISWLVSAKITMTIILYVAFMRRYNKYKGKSLALLKKFESF